MRGNKDCTTCLYGNESALCGEHCVPCREAAGHMPDRHPGHVDVWEAYTRLLAAAQKMAGALKFYARKASYRSPDCQTTDKPIAARPPAPVALDEGREARAALEGFKEWRERK